MVSNLQTILLTYFIGFFVALIGIYLQILWIMADTTGLSDAYYSALDTSQATLYASCINSSVDEEPACHGKNPLDGKKPLDGKNPLDVATRKKPDCAGFDGTNLGPSSQSRQYTAAEPLLIYGGGRAGWDLAASKKLGGDKKGSVDVAAGKEPAGNNKGSVLGSVSLPPCTPPPLALSFLAGKVVAFDYRDLVGRTSTPKVLPTGETICFELFPCLTYFFYFF